MIREPWQKDALLMHGHFPIRAQLHAVVVMVVLCYVLLLLLLVIQESNMILLLCILIQDSHCGTFMPEYQSLRMSLAGHQVIVVLDVLPLVIEIVLMTLSIFVRINFAHATSYCSQHCAAAHLIR